LQPTQQATMKRIFFMLLLLPLAAAAQKDHKTHTVGPKESLTSIGRLYNINGRELANYNNIDYEKGLSIGQVLKIPAKAGNTDVYIPPPPAKTAEVKVAEVKPTAAAPVKKGAALYHTVEKKQTLYAISKLYNVSVAEIKQWNNLAADGLSEGANIIVGYNGTAAVKPAAPPETKIPEGQGNYIGTVEQKGEPAPAKTVVKEEPKPEKKPEPVKQVVAAPVKEAADFKGGVFKTDYTEQAKSNHIITESGSGGIFKSTSGWQDGKYYCLHNMATPGTIIKITNNVNGKSVFAKVLDMMPDIKQNNGLVIIVSNAAAGVLGVAEGKIDCTLNYSK
jgi:LysM repeat protein